MSRVFVLLALLCACLPGARARAESIPNSRACTAAYRGTGQSVSVRERIGASGFAAYATYDPDGWPSITYAPAYFVLPPTVQTFLSLHECGHLVLTTTNEFEANCYAMAQRDWTREEIDLIALSHRSVGQIGPQYGGSGRAFWEGTKRLCPQYFQ